MPDREPGGAPTSEIHDAAESIPGARDESRLPPSAPIFTGLSEAQRTLVERVRDGTAKPPPGGGDLDRREWWKIAVLDDALQQQRRSLSKRDRQGAFEQIRKGAIPGWLYKSEGKRSAYFLEVLQSEPSLPKEFRATAEDRKRADDTRARARILQTIDMATEDYRAIRLRDLMPAAEIPPFRSAKEGARWLKELSAQREEELRRLLEPYADAIDSMLENADLGISRDWQRASWTESHNPMLVGDVPHRLRGEVSALLGFQYARRTYRWLLSLRARIELGVDDRTDTSSAPQDTQGRQRATLMSPDD